LPVDFARITAQYRQVLAQAPDHVTAQRRLGQILLSQNDVVGAERHLVIAHRLAPDQRATRQLLGEVYALQGNVEAAERIWQGLDLSQGQLTLRFQWYAETGKFRESLQLARAAKRVVARVE
jgi:predicted Zn-dependent protease